MAIVFKANQDPYGLSALGQLAGTFLGQKHSQAQLDKDFSILSDTLSQLQNEPQTPGKENPQSLIQRFITEGQKKGVKSKSLEKYLGMSPGQALLQEQYIKERKSPVQVNITPEERAFQTASGRQLAERVNSIQESGRKASETISTLNSMRELSNKFSQSSGVFGYWGDAKAAQADFEVKALESAQQLFHIVAPVGTISKPKFDFVTKNLIPNSTDPYKVRESKIKAAEDFAKQALAPYKKLQDVFDEFDDPPQALIKKALKEYDRELTRIVDETAININKQSKKEKDEGSGDKKRPSLEEIFSGG